MELIKTISGRTDSHVEEIVSLLQNRAKAVEIEDGVIYIGWPRFTDYDLIQHTADLAILSKKTGLLLLRRVGNQSFDAVTEIAESLAQTSATALSLLIKSPRLRKSGNKLRVSVQPLIIAFGYRGAEPASTVLISNPQNLIRYINDVSDNKLSEDAFQETRAIIEGVKALSRSNRRSISNPTKHLFAAALQSLEDEIAKFDAKQRRVALSVPNGPQRIRGLAGSGKTVILALKAALAHQDNPDANILVTFYTRSLRNHLTRLITRFYRHFADGEPNWDNVHVYHGWGRTDLPGVYREACKRAGLASIPFNIASERAAAGQSPFDYVCTDLLARAEITPYYDTILIDEGQDFPSSFYQVCYFLAKGSRDKKQIVWAYDELQNVFDVKVRTPEELFGTDSDKKPRISLRRSLPKHVDTNDFVLPKCYRNQRDVLVLAHAAGFGIYGQPVQMLESKEHWEDVGYEVISGSMKPHTNVIIRRPDHNNPTQLKANPGTPLVEIQKFETATEEIEYCADQLALFIKGGLQPEDLLVIAIDDRAAKKYLTRMSEELNKRGIATNNVVADRYSEPAFLIEGKCTLSTVYRAKGNEAAVVAVLGCDAIPLRKRSGRNRLFTAFTRTKGWLRVTGMGEKFDPLRSELQTALANAPQMNFRMPDPREIELIQRDLSERDSRIQRAAEELSRLRDQLDLNQKDLEEILDRLSSNEKS